MRQRLEYCAEAWGRGELEALLATGQRTAGLRRGLVWGWSLSAVFLVLAVLGWWPRLHGLVADPEADFALLRSSPAVEREQLLHSDVRYGRWPWVRDTGAASHVRGDVVWDGQHQAGYLTFEGLAPTLGTGRQYQLWIFDSERDDRYPVDGGVFDVAPGERRIVVPFHALRWVSRPVAFAVTVEKQGGVVVSTRENVVALARATDS